MNRFVQITVLVKIMPLLPYFMMVPESYIINTLQNIELIKEK
jgi:hypothetical protein